MTKVAVVILNWNGESFLKKFLPDVVKHASSENYKVIVVDNASTDNSVEFLKQNFEFVEVMVFDKNYGFAGGYQKAFETIQAEYFVMLNSDIEVSPNWVDPIIQLMDKDQSIGAAMPKIISYNKKTDFEYAGAAGGYIDRFGYPFCRGRMLSEIEQDNGQYNNTAQVFWATGACFFIRSKAYHEAGGLDDRFFAHMEEIDLCWRLQLKGYKIMAVPESKVYHVGGGTLPNNNPRKLYLNYRNSLFLMFKNLPGKKLLPVLLVRLMLDGASGMVYLLKGSFGFFWAVIRAHFSFYRQLPDFYKTRRQAGKIITYPNTIYPRSLLKQFFILRKKKFSNLESLNFQ